jgi:alpha-ketoglutaric semialdehyde dehydrogenase|nr:MAG: fatty aldehyde dehydrogenase [Bacteroidota bacterium]
MSELTGASWIQARAVRGRGRPFWAINPATGSKLEPCYRSATYGDVDRAARAAAEAFPALVLSPAEVRARLLERIAEHLEASAPRIIARADQETALGRGRLEQELRRTTGQLRLFAEVLRAGWWRDVRLDRADPDRKPTPKPELRSFRLGMGPVAVFGAANFPLAFSVAGGDTASALAAGCPVLLKAHPAHPGTSELAAQAILRALDELKLPAGSFALLFDAGFSVGRALVRHPAVRAVAFTGSRQGGMALWRLAAQRPDPIPVFAEMGSLNPVLVLPGALRERAEAIAEGLYASFTLGAGQFCTRPGLVLLPRLPEAERFRRRLRALLEQSQPGCLLTERIHAGYQQGLARLQEAGLQPFWRPSPPRSESPWPADPTVWEAPLAMFWQRAELHEEVFGPTTVLLWYEEPEELSLFVAHLEGQLALCLQAANPDQELARRLIEEALHRAGRIVWNGFPTGVEVGYSTVHGGPFPATTDSRFTSVGARAIERFLRPVALQNVPTELLPAALTEQRGPHLLDGKWQPC